MVVTAVAAPSASTAAAGAQPSVLVVTVDALRTDRLSCYGYERPTSPQIDRLLARGARFTDPRTVEPLTNPALCSMITSLAPHEHGATRNGLRMEPGLSSLPKVLAASGYHTGAFVANWTLKDHLSRLGEHFQDYDGVFTRRRWFGLINAEANAEDVSDAALEWLVDHLRQQPSTPFFLWLHYVEPHAPYRFHNEFAKRLGITDRSPPPSDRYDTEVAMVDHEIGRVVRWLAEQLPPERVIVVFLADHGESLGEHDYWGHGRNLYEETLSIPMGVVWPGHIPPGVVEGSPLNTDLPRTILDLLGLPAPEAIEGSSWAAALRRDGEAPGRGVTCHQAHKGAVKGDHDSDRARSKGLLEVGVVREDGRKETIRIRSSRRQAFDLSSDPRERNDLAVPGEPPSDELLQCMAWVLEGLERMDALPTDQLDEESVEQLRALGYIE